jgi:ABC-type transporter Mla MlaB component
MRMRLDNSTQRVDSRLFRGQSHDSPASRQALTELGHLKYDLAGSVGSSFAKWNAPDVLIVRGDVRDERIVQDLHERCRCGLVSGAKLILLDLSDVRVADTKLVACLLACLRMAHREGAQLRIRPSAAVQTWCNLCRINLGPGLLQTARSAGRSDTNGSDASMGCSRIRTTKRSGILLLSAEAATPRGARLGHDPRSSLTTHQHGIDEHDCRGPSAGHRSEVRAFSDSDGCRDSLGIDDRTDDCSAENRRPVIGGDT